MCLIKGYALIDVLTTPTSMVIVASASATEHQSPRESRNDTVKWELRDREKISTMTSVGDSTSATQRPVVFVLRKNRLAV